MDDDAYARVLAMLADECQIYVPLEEIIEAVREDLGLTDPAEIRQMVLSLVRDLLRDHAAIACRPEPDWLRVATWDLPEKCALDRIDHEWAALGRDPRHNEIVCFILADDPLA